MVKISPLRMLALAASFLLPLSTHAQLLDKKTLSLEAANKIIAGAIIEAKANNWSVDIAIVDEGGHLLSFQRMDGASIGAIEAAIGKARTSSLYRRPTKALEEAAKTRPAIVTLPNSVQLQGGVPSKDGKAAYLLAQDGGPGSFEEPDFELSSLYEQIAKSRVGEASIFIDACFSGRSSKDTIVFEGVAPISKAQKKSIDQSGRVSIITAGKGGQFANQNKTRGHRLFGYHLMRTLIDDTSISKTSDLYIKVREKVLSDSRRLGPEYEQEPELLGNPNIKIIAQ